MPKLETASSQKTTKPLYERPRFRATNLS